MFSELKPTEYPKRSKLHQTTGGRIFLLFVAGASILGLSYNDYKHQKLKEEIAWEILLCEEEKQYGNKHFKEMQERVDTESNKHIQEAFVSKNKKQLQTLIPQSAPYDKPGVLNLVKLGIPWKDRTFRDNNAKTFTRTIGAYYAGNKKPIIIFDNETTKEQEPVYYPGLGRISHKEINFIAESE